MGVIPIYKCERGDTVRVTVVFTDNSGLLIDPTDPTYDVRTPDGATYKAATTLDKVGTGTYQADIDTTFNADLGYWRVRVWGTYSGHRILDSEKFLMVDVE